MSNPVSLFLMTSSQTYKQTHIVFDVYNKVKSHTTWLRFNALDSDCYSILINRTIKEKNKKNMGKGRQNIKNVFII